MLKHFNGGFLYHRHCLTSSFHHKYIHHTIVIIPFDVIYQLSVYKKSWFWLIYDIVWKNFVYTVHKWCDYSAKTKTLRFRTESIMSHLTRRPQHRSQALSLSVPYWFLVPRLYFFVDCRWIGLVVPQMCE